MVHPLFVVLDSNKIVFFIWISIFLQRLNYIPFFWLYIATISILELYRYG